MYYDSLKNQAPNAPLHMTFFRSSQLFPTLLFHIPLDKKQQRRFPALPAISFLTFYTIGSSNVTVNTAGSEHTARLHRMYFA